MQTRHIALGGSNRGDANDVETLLKIATNSETEFTEDEVEAICCIAWQAEIAGESVLQVPDVCAP
jgi:hypothetical protein